MSFFKLFLTGDLKYVYNIYINTNTLNKMTTRRKFIKSLGGMTLSSSFLPVLSAKDSPSLPPGDDFKAIVCISLNGGNDAFNMLLPSNNFRYIEYKEARGGGNNADSNISVANNILDLPDL